MINFIIRGILILVGLITAIGSIIFINITYSRTKFNYNSEGNYYDSLTGTTYNSQAIIGYSIITCG